MSRIFLRFLSLYAIILLQICLKKKTQRLRHFTLVWCYLTLNFTHLHYSCALQTGGVEPLPGISFHRERVKKLQQGVIQYFAYT